MTLDRSQMGSFAMEAIDSIENGYKDAIDEGAELEIEAMILVCAVVVKYPDQEQGSSSIIYHSDNVRFWSVAGMLDAAKESIYRDE